MMTAEQIIQTVCTELADSPSLSQYVQLARESLSSRFFGKTYEQAVAYKACHLFIQTKPSELNKMTEVSGGSISHLKEGGIDIGFNASASDKELSSTKFGRMLLDLIKTRPTMDVNRNCRPPLIYPML